MNFLMTPVLIIGLLASPTTGADSPAVNAAPAAAVAAPQAVPPVVLTPVALASPAAVVSPLEQQARKHTTFYRLLIAAQKKAGGEDPAAQRYSVQAPLSGLTLE